MAIASIDDQPGLDDIGTSPPTLAGGACDNRPRRNDIGAPRALLDDRACVFAAELPAPLPPDLTLARDAERSLGGSRMLGATTAGCAEDAG